jgi:hypothetical protein
MPLRPVATLPTRITFLPNYLNLVYGMSTPFECLVSRSSTTAVNLRGRPPDAGDGDSGAATARVSLSASNPGT